MKVGRNEPCPCGSGARYKNCCAGKDRGMSRVTMVAIAVGVLSLAGMVTWAVTNRGSARPTAANLPATGAPAGGAPMAQPPGPAPAGKVWSAEHGHWHDAPVGGAVPATGSRTVTTSPGVTVTPGATTTPAPAGQPVPQPPGPAPAGKVWSAEHGHWHDAPQ